MICTRCGTANHTTLRGSGWIELVLWLCWLLPGVIYTIWRRGKRPACAACGSHDLVPLDSPAGRRLAAKYGVTPAAAPAPAGPPAWGVLAAVLVLLVAIGSFPLWAG